MSYNHKALLQKTRRLQTDLFLWVVIPLLILILAVASTLAQGADTGPSRKVAYLPPQSTIDVKTGKPPAQSTVAPQNAKSTGQNDSPPKGYPPAPEGYKWVPNPAGPDGWGLQQIGITKASSVSIAPPQAPKVLTTADGRRYVYQCQGGQCVRVYLP